MSDERDTRVEELRPGDQVRYLGEWVDVVKVRPGLGVFRDPVVEDAAFVGDLYSPSSYIALDVDDGRTLFFRRGLFVAAKCNPRSEGIPA